MSSFQVIKVFILRMFLQKYKLYYVILDVVFIILGQFLQIIYVDGSIVEITNILKSFKLPYPLNPLL